MSLEPLSEDDEGLHSPDSHGIATFPFHGSSSPSFHAFSLSSLLSWLRHCKHS